MSSVETYFDAHSRDDSFYIQGESFLSVDGLENYLDKALDQGYPQAAYEVEDELLHKVETHPHISSRIARLSTKAITIAQYARQHETTAPHTKETTYQNLGKLTGKILSSVDTIRPHIRREEETYLEYRKLIGILSETAIYMLLGFDNKMEHSLSGRKRELPTHYTVPAYYTEDRGPYDPHYDPSNPGIGLGFDFKLFTEDTNERVIPLQVKTSLHGLGDRLYAPDITVVTLDKILPENQQNETLLATLLTEDAAGRYSSKGKRQINAAVRNLDRLIASGGVKSPAPHEEHSSVDEFEHR